LHPEPGLCVPDAHQRPPSLLLLAAQGEALLPLLDAFPRALLRLRAVVEPGPPFVRREDAAVPDDHFPGPVLAGRDDPLERRVVVGMVFDMDGEALVVRIEGRPLGTGPGQEDTVALESYVIM